MNKYKKIGVGVALGLILTHLLVGFEIQGFNQAVELTTYLFNKPAEDYSINVPHAKDTAQNLIKWTFGKDSKVMLAVAQAESGLNPQAKGYNCKYGVCRKEDRSKAISVDCGIMQINVAGATCPQQLLDPVYNVKVAAYGKYQRQGKKAWSAYNNGNYKKYLNT